MPSAKLSTSCMSGSWNMVDIICCGFAWSMRSFIMKFSSPSLWRSVGCCASLGMRSGPSAAPKGLFAADWAAPLALFTSTTPCLSAASPGATARPAWYAASASSYFFMACSAAPLRE